MDATLLAKLRGDQPPIFLLNGWNEVPVAGAEAADTALREMIGPSRDMAKWNFFRQQQDLLQATAPKIILDALSPKLERDPEETELGLLTDVLGRLSPTRTDTRTALPDEVRRKPGLVLALTGLNPAASTLVAEKCYFLCKETSLLRSPSLLVHSWIRPTSPRNWADSCVK